ncbi:unnamed protein product, partial [Nesidiocoris tenuis]
KSDYHKNQAQRRSGNQFLPGQMISDGNGLLAVIRDAGRIVVVTILEPPNRRSIAIWWKGSYQPSNSLMLDFYAYYKQATEGTERGSRPSFWDVINRAKWDAWNRLGDMPKEEAMQRYVDGLNKAIKTRGVKLNQMAPGLKCGQRMRPGGRAWAVTNLTLILSRPTRPSKGSPRRPRLAGAPSRGPSSAAQSSPADPKSESKTAARVHRLVLCPR